MPLVNIKIIEGVFSEEQKQEMIQNVRGVTLDGLLPK
jgi:phenylpyruvate tautomerase PptA (4-oxalocrotonate tautomerase family)